MSFGFPLLLGPGTLAQAHRWRLMDNVFGTRRPSIEGCGAFAAAALVGYLRTFNPRFLVMLGAGLAVLAARLFNARHYMRASGPGAPRRRTPDYWAVQYSTGAVVAALCWVAIDMTAFHSRDARLPFFVMAVQSGWLGGSSPRLAALPAAALWQALVILVPEMIFAFTLHDSFIWMLVPFGLLQIMVTMGLVRSTGKQITSLILSEQELEKANARLTELSATDGLTGIANRRAFEGVFEKEWGRAAREGTDIAVLMIDVDHFKAYNDHYGHPAGDACLLLVAERIAAALRRPPDLAARFGGEEFVALLPGVDGAAAMEVAERVRLAIMDAAVTHAGSAFGCVTVSIGSASLAPHPGQARQVLIDLADRALYEGKQSGRNMVRGAGRGLKIGAWGPAGAY